MTTTNHPPIQRHASLAPLSRDHYVGLVQARRLTKAAGGDDVARRVAVAQFVDAWDGEIAQHMRDEERLLADLMSAADRRRMLDEHAQLFELATRARTLRRQVAPDPRVMQQIGSLLDQHIRWEERQMFNRLQDQLDDQQLHSLKQQTDALEQARPRNIARSTTR